MSSFERDLNMKANRKFLDVAIDDVSSINWQYNQHRTKEQIEEDKLLVIEYFRRLKAFLQYISTDSNYPYIDPVKLINKQSKLQYEDVEEICLNVNKIGGVSKFFCIYHIIWSSMVDDEEAIALKFKDLFNPLIELFKRGGYWSTEHGILDVSGSFLCLLSEWHEVIHDDGK